MLMHILKKSVCWYGPLESVIELVDSSPDSANSTTNIMIVSRLPILNMFDIFTPIQSAVENRPNIAGGQLQIGLLEMGLWE